MTTALKTLESSKKAVGPLPVPNGDFYQVTECLNDAERAILRNVRAFMETKVAPTISKYWAEDSFPSELASGMRELKIAGAGYEGYGCAGGSTLREWTARAPRSSASIAALRWGRSSCAALKSRRRSSYRPWRAWKRLAPSA